MSQSPIPITQLKANIQKKFKKDLSDAFFSEFFSGEEFKTDNFLKQYIEGKFEYDEGASRVIVGGFAKEENRESFFELFEHVKHEEIDFEILGALYFGKPTNDLWMRDSESVAFVSEIARRIGGLRKERPELRLVLNSRFERFDHVDRRLRHGNNHRIFAKAFSTNFLKKWL